MSEKIVNYIVGTVLWIGFPVSVWACIAYFLFA